MSNLFNLLGRLGLSLIFIVSGWAKISGYAGTQQYMEAMSVPGALLPLVILLELGGGLAILGGLFTRWIAIALALFSVASGFLFHWNPEDQMQFVNLMKNIAIAGGFLLLAANGAGAFSLDARIAKRGRKANGGGL
ncbi:MAG: DoxX family protein [Pseudomonas sp.]|nr:DoxX family protein [Pseudomonas sp.]